MASDAVANEIASRDRLVIAGAGHPLRIDKFLKVSRLAKRRSEAHEALVHGRISKDHKPLKPGYEVRVGDIIELHYARKFVTVRVLAVPERVTPAMRDVPLYETIEERRDEPSDWLIESTPL